MRGQRTGAASGHRRARWPRCAHERGKAIVLLNRRGWSNFLSCRCVRAGVALPGLRRRAGAAPRRGRSSPATTAATASALPDAAARTAARRAVARHGAGTERLAHELASDLRRRRLPRLAPRRGHDVGRGRRRAHGSLLRRLRGGAMRRPDRHADGREGPRLPGREPRGGARRRRDAALPGLPRRGADVRADRQLAGRVGRGGHGRVLVQTIAPEARRDPCTPHATTATVSSPASSSAGARSATRRSRT